MSSPSRAGPASTGAQSAGDGTPVRNAAPASAPVRFGHREPWQSLIEFDLDLKPHAHGSASPARRRLAARLLHLAPGPFDARTVVGDPAGWLGLLVVDGLALVQVDAGRAPIGWLVGAEDVVRPWEMLELSLLAPASWQILTPMRLALLDADFARRVAGVPAIADALLAKSMQTSHWLFAKSLVTGTAVIEERLLLLFALLGERWGKATSAGVVVAMPLTHQVLATLIGARRPSVSTALRALSTAGMLRRIEDGWLLCRRPAVSGPRPRCWPQYAQALGLAVR